MDLLNNPLLQEQLAKFKKASQDFRPNIRKQILRERVNLDTYIEWLKSTGNGIDARAAAAELRNLENPEFKEQALENLAQVFLDQPGNQIWLDDQVELRIKQLKDKNNGLTK